MTITHHAIREAIRARIKDGEWALGAMMPGEAEFAAEYGCARTTVNRTLRALAEEGIVERRRRGGTRVRPLPLPQAQLTIPLVREQVEATGRIYSHCILAREARRAPRDVAERMRLHARARLVWLETLHRADGQPFALERRWVDCTSVPAFETADLSGVSANEWLVRSVPFSNGQVALSAVAADPEAARIMALRAGDPLFAMQRTTWLDGAPITTMTLLYPAAYRLEFPI